MFLSHVGVGRSGFLDDTVPMSKLLTRYSRGDVKEKRTLIHSNGFLLYPLILALFANNVQELCRVISDLLGTSHPQTKLDEYSRRELTITANHPTKVWLKTHWCLFIFTFLECMPLCLLWSSLPVLDEHLCGDYLQLLGNALFKVENVPHQTDLVYVYCLQSNKLLCTQDRPIGGSVLPNRWQRVCLLVLQVHFWLQTPWLYPLICPMLLFPSLRLSSSTGNVSHPKKCSQRDFTKSLLSSSFVMTTEALHSDPWVTSEQKIDTISCLLDVSKKNQSIHSWLNPPCSEYFQAWIESLTPVLGILQNCLDPGESGICHDFKSQVFFAVTKYQPYTSCLYLCQFSISSFTVWKH